MPKENKIDQIGHRIRLSMVSRMLLEGQSTADIWKLANIPKETGGLGWNLSKSQIHRYVRTCAKYFSKLLDKNDKQVLDEHILKRNEIYKKAIRDGNYKYALSALTDIAKLQDLYPKNFEISGSKGGEPILVEFVPHESVAAEVEEMIKEHAATEEKFSDD